MQQRKTRNIILTMLLALSLTFTGAYAKSSSSSSSSGSSSKSSSGSSSKSSSSKSSSGSSSKSSSSKSSSGSSSKSSNSKSSSGSSSKSSSSKSSSGSSSKSSSGKSSNGSNSKSSSGKSSSGSSSTSTSTPTKSTTSSAQTTSPSAIGVGSGTAATPSPTVNSSVIPELEDTPTIIVTAGKVGANVDFIDLPIGESPYYNGKLDMAYYNVLPNQSPNLSGAYPTQGVDDNTKYTFTPPDIDSEDDIISLEKTESYWLSDAVKLEGKNSTQKVIGYVNNGVFVGAMLDVNAPDPYRTSSSSNSYSSNSSVFLGGVSAVGGFAKDTVSGAWSYYSDSVNSLADMAFGGALSKKYSAFAAARARNDARGEAIVGAPSAVIGGVKSAVSNPKLTLQKTTDYARNGWNNNVAKPFLSGDGYTAGYNFVYGGLALATMATPRGLVTNAGKTAIVGEGAALANLTIGDIARIQNAANRTQTPIAVVGSRASGTAHGLSDWDYVVPQGTPKSTIHSLSSSLPEGFRSLGESRNQDFFTGNVSTNLPYIQFNPVNSTSNNNLLNQTGGGTPSKNIAEPTIDVKCDNCGGG